MQEALKLFVAFRWASTHRLTIESDSSNVVYWIRNPHGIPWTMKKIMGHIVNLTDQLLGWEIGFIPREGNVLADALAKSEVSRHHDLVVLYD